MNQDFDFFKTSMPPTRKADYYIGGLDSSVFIDFNRAKENRISLVRISFDGYGCCNLDDKGLSLNETDSVKFIEEMEGDMFNQETITRLVKEIININKDNIWLDALKKYKLISD